MPGFSFPDLEGSSFFDYLLQQHPELLPARRWARQAPGAQPADFSSGSVPGALHGTTVLALKYEDGVVIAGDRRATEGFQIAGRQMEKVFKIDEHSAMAIAGTAGHCIEMARLFQTELEHYEKL